MATVQDNEHLAFQQHALFSVALRKGGPFWPGVVAVEDPMARVDLAREVVCSLVPVGASLQRHWRKWMEVGAGKWVVKTLHYEYVLPFLHPPPLSARPIEFVSYAEESYRHVTLDLVVQDMLGKGAVAACRFSSDTGWFVFTDHSHHHRVEEKQYFPLTVY
ncbi:hypothetical protein E2C01_079137 [Portunus trituberculatus]|uniref:Uncharacterized protein n=1 Tax=Portunus trituberculatus TaxID=210409 RepID=A0A5B7IQN4_PORTR|nr:hypothetical protein [Portunus trituberculatus]